MQVGCLTVKPETDEEKRYLLKDLTVFEGGRSQGHHVYIKHESVAFSHFRIYKNGDNYSISDLGSSKGTKVNDQPVEKTTPLAHGDRLLIGEVELLFEMVDDSGPGRAASSAPELSGEAAEKVLSLVVVDGKEKGETFALPGKQRVKIGRAVGSDLKLSDGKISREHCLVEAVRDHHIIIDLESSNGTVVNGERIKKTVLKEGDYIRLGFTLIRYDRV